MVRLCTLSPAFLLLSVMNSPCQCGLSHSCLSYRCPHSLTAVLLASRTTALIGESIVIGVTVRYTYTRRRLRSPNSDDACQTLRDVILNNGMCNHDCSGQSPLTILGPHDRYSLLQVGVMPLNGSWLISPMPLLASRSYSTSLLQPY